MVENFFERNFIWSELLFCGAISELNGSFFWNKKSQFRIIQNIDKQSFFGIFKKRLLVFLNDLYLRKFLETT